MTLNSIARESELFTEFGCTKTGPCGTQQDEKLKFQCAIIWHLATSASAAPSILVEASIRKQQNVDFTYYNAPAKPGTKACEAFNEGHCTSAAAHTSQLQFCSHCLAMVTGPSPIRR